LDIIRIVSLNEPPVDLSLGPALPSPIRPTVGLSGVVIQESGCGVCAAPMITRLLEDPGARRSQLERKAVATA